MVPTHAYFFAVKVVAFFRLVRWQNLLIIAATQYLFRHFVLLPAMRMWGLGSALSEWEFALFVFSVVCVAAAGYLINDYHDTATDIINKPERVVVGTHFRPLTVLGIYVLFNLVGVALGFWTAWQAGRWMLGFFHLLVAGLLWFYSTSYKHMPLVGNMVIATLTALVVVVVYLWEVKLYQDVIHVYGFYHLAWAAMVLTGVYSFFAFFISLARELVKDIEDMHGDTHIYSRTFPIVFGVTNAKWVAGLSAFVVLVCIAFLGYRLYTAGNLLLAGYVFLLVELPLLYFFFVFVRAHKKSHFHRLSIMLKLIMVAGVLSMVVYGLPMLVR